MSDTVTFTIDGKEVSADKGTSLLMAARSLGIDIPTLCHHDELADFGACRLCIVEIDKGGWKKIVTSCLYPVEDGLSVETESEKVIRHRRTILELLRARWSEMPRELIEKYQVPEDRMETESTFCVMCGLCVRHCSERKGANVLGFVGRGTERQVVAHEEPALKYCRDCAAENGMECLAVCPTGVVVNDFALSPPHMTPKGTKARPVRARDNENQEEVNKLIGD